MAVPASVENYTVPGGVKFYFDDGAGERDLGNITEVDIEGGTEELEHFSNRSGKRLKDKVIVLEEKLTVKFKFDEPVIENLKYYFKGGDIENLGAGTGAIVDKELALSGVTLRSVGQYSGLTAVTVRQFLNKCFAYDGAAFVDHSVEADTLVGTPFTPIADTDDVLYLGKDTKFKEVFFDFATPGSYGAVVVEYWNGTAWAAVTGLAGAAAALAADGKMQWDLPATWAVNTINGYSAYYIKITATTPWTTPATINTIRQSCVALTDYVLDAGVAGEEGRLPGRIGRLAAGMLVDGEEVKVSFTYATWASAQFAIAGASFIQGAARLEVHPDAGRGIRFDVIIPKSILKPNGSIGLDDKKWLEVPMILEALDDTANTPAAPLGYYKSYESVT
jgi:hypothetical protein